MTEVLGPQPPLVESECGSFFGRARLDLDECEGAAAARDAVHYAAGHTGAAGKNSQALEPQVPAGERLGAASAPLGRLAIHRERSRARA